MTFPVDDQGNPRVDFVWGNMAIQPDDNRTGEAITYVNNNQPQDRGWSRTSPAAKSETLATSYTQHLSVGDKDNVYSSWDSVPTRPVIVPATHEVVTARYEGFPSFIQGAPFDDIIPNVTVPSVVDFDSVEAATAYLEDAGLTVGIVTQTETGATSENNNWVKSQNPAPGTLVNAGSAVNLVKYNYVVTAFPVAGITFDPMAMGNEYNLFLQGRINKPAVGDRITVTGSDYQAYNTTWKVRSVQNDDAFNTGGTKVGLTPVVWFSGFYGTKLGGLWAVVPRVTPTSVDLAGNSQQMSYVTVDNSANGKVQIKFPTGTSAYNDIDYSVTTPANNGWLGKTVTFSNFSASGMGGSPLVGAKTVLVSSYNAGDGTPMNRPGYSLVLDDTTNVGAMMGPVNVNSGTMGISA